LIDLHSHLLPGVDDGSRSVGQSVEALRALGEQGVSVVVTTPHFDVSLARNPAAFEARLAAFDQAFAELQSVITEASGLPELRRGAEILLDEPDATVTDARLRLDGSPYVLCEFARLRLPTNADWGIRNLVTQGWRPVIGHPERYRNVDGSLTMLRQLREAGAAFQLNVGSLVGEFGETAQRIGWELLSRGWIDYCASDFHARGPLMIQQATAHLATVAGTELVELLTRVNPQRLLLGESLLPVPRIVLPRSSTAWWHRLRDVFNGNQR
jgi:protein-tyrosine phosphatase